MRRAGFVVVATGAALAAAAAALFFFFWHRRRREGLTSPPPPTTSMLDLAELRGLDPGLAKLYRELVVGTLAPRLVVAANAFYNSMTPAQKAQYAAVSKASTKELVARLDGLTAAVKTGKFDAASAMLEAAKVTA